MEKKGLVCFHVAEGGPCPLGRTVKRVCQTSWVRWMNLSILSIWVAS